MLKSQELSMEPEHRSALNANGLPRYHILGRLKRGKPQGRRHPVGLGAHAQSTPREDAPFAFVSGEISAGVKLSKSVSEQL